MRKLFAISSLFIFSTAFARIDYGYHKKPQSVSPALAAKSQALAPSAAAMVDGRSIDNGVLVVKPMQVSGFDATSRKKLDQAFALIEKVVNSEEFKLRVLNFKNRKGERAFASNQGLTNEEIYQKFMEGRETLQPTTPGEMNYFVSMYYSRWSRVIGYTNPNTSVIYVNWKYFGGFTPAQVAANLVHEWTHKIGFDHTSAAEYDSAPYAIGYIVEELATLQK